MKVGGAKLNAGGLLSHQLYRKLRPCHSIYRASQKFCSIIIVSFEVLYY